MEKGEAKATEQNAKKKERKPWPKRNRREALPNEGPIWCPCCSASISPHLKNSKECNCSNCNRTFCKSCISKLDLEFSRQCKPRNQQGTTSKEMTSKEQRSILKNTISEAGKIKAQEFEKLEIISGPFGEKTSSDDQKDPSQLPEDYKQAEMLQDPGTDTEKFCHRCQVRKRFSKDSLQELSNRKLKKIIMILHIKPSEVELNKAALVKEILLKCKAPVPENSGPQLSSSEIRNGIPNISDSSSSSKLQNDGGPASTRDAEESQWQPVVSSEVTKAEKTLNLEDNPEESIAAALPGIPTTDQGDQSHLSEEHQKSTPMSENCATVTGVDIVTSCPLAVREDASSDIKDARNMTIRELKAFLESRGTLVKPGEEKRTLLHAVIRIQDTERNASEGLTRTDSDSGIRTQETKQQSDNQG